jgi:hypothetical protein
MRQVQCAVAALLAAWPVAAQVASWRGPVAGLVYDAPSRSLRPVVGFPGSSYLGTPVEADLDGAFIAPDGSAALIVQSGQASLAQGLRSASPTIVPISGIEGGADRVAWARNSSALVVFSAATRQLRRISLTGASPQVGAPVDLGSLTGDVTGLATDSDATQVVFALRGEEQAGFYAVPDGGAPFLLSATRDPGGASFATEPGALYLLDREAGRVLRFSRGIYSAPETLEFSGEPAPLADPVGLAVSADDQRLFVAGGTDRLIRIYSIGTRSVLLDVPVDESPLGLSPLAATNSLFLLGDRTLAKQPIWILDARVTPSVFFVPAGE